MKPATPGNNDDPGGSADDEARTLSALRQSWGGAWAIDHPDMRWRARRESTVLTRASAPGLELALQISHAGFPL